jgi:hypothetical protein
MEPTYFAILLLGQFITIIKSEHDYFETCSLPGADVEFEAAVE